jgi:hypothetical protein
LSCYCGLHSGLQSSAACDGKGWISRRILTLNWKIMQGREDYRELSRGFFFGPSSQNLDSIGFSIDRLVCSAAKYCQRRTYTQNIPE